MHLKGQRNYCGVVWTKEKIVDTIKNSRLYFFLLLLKFQKNKNKMFIYLHKGCHIITNL